MADSRNNRDGRTRDGAGHPFLVEAPQVFQTAATAAYDQDIHVAPAVKIVQGRGDFPGGARSLDTYARHNDMQVIKSARQDVQDITDRRAGG